MIVVVYLVHGVYHQVAVFFFAPDQVSGRVSGAPKTKNPSEIVVNLCRSMRHITALDF